MYIPLVSVSLRKPLINRKILERGELKQNLRNGVINPNQFYSLARGIQISWELEFRFHKFLTIFQQGASNDFALIKIYQLTF